VIDSSFSETELGLCPSPNKPTSHHAVSFCFGIFTRQRPLQQSSPVQFSNPFVSAPACLSSIPFSLSLHISSFAT